PAIITNFLSSLCSNCADISFQSPGDANRTSPSITSTRHSAAPRLPTRLLAFLQVAQELGLRIEHDHAVRRRQRVAIRLEAAVERVELRIAAVRARIDLGRLRI